VHTVEDVSPQTVNHSGQFAGGGDLVRPETLASRWAMRSTRFARASARGYLPATMTVAFEGSAKAFEDSVRNLGLLLIVAIGVVYIVLGNALRELHSPAHDSVRALPSARSRRAC